MQRLRWSAIALVGTCVLVATGAAACGSDENTNTDTTDAAAPDATGTSDAGATDGAQCNLLGASCTSSAECCSASCDAKTKVCENALGSCKAAGSTCGAPNECCTFVCNGGTCGATLCTSDNQPCTSGAACCGGVCEAAADGGPQVCKPLNAVCKTSGNTCTLHDDCCSKVCNNGVCAGQPSFCTQSGDACSKDGECCGGVCTKAAGATLGLCGVPSVPGATGCTVAGQVCGAGAAADGGVRDSGVPTCGGECCSRSCTPWQTTGVLVCQPPSGCRPTGETCRSDNDCCGSPNLPGGNGSVHCSKAKPSDAVGRCDNGNACRAAGAVCKLATTSCNAENNCCAGNVNQNPFVCQQDLLGIPRCTGVGDCTKRDAGSLAGTACATSADCCGLACVPNPVAGGAPLVCGAACVDSGGKCTTTADCCKGGQCNTAPGSTVGTCSAPPTTGGGGTTPGTDGGTGGDGGTTPGTDGGGGCGFYGQSCTTSGDCCSEFYCAFGRCKSPS